MRGEEDEWSNQRRYPDAKSSAASSSRLSRRSRRFASRNSPKDLSICWSKAGPSGVKYPLARSVYQARLQLSISDIPRTCVLVSLRSRDGT